MNTEIKINESVLGLFETRSALVGAVDSLKIEGFRNSDISTLPANEENNQDLTHEKATRVFEGTVLGATVGMVIGVALGWLASVGALTIPGGPSFVFASPMVAVMAGAILCSTAAGLVGAMIGKRIPQHDTKPSSSNAKSGALLLSVHVDNFEWAKKAKKTLKNAGAEQIASEKEVFSMSIESKLC